MLSHSIAEELIERLDKAQPSKYDPKTFFHGCRGIKARDIMLYQDNNFIYAVREKTLITVLSVPGTDAISDFIRNNR